MLESGPKQKLPGRKSGIVIPHQPTWQQRVAGTLASFLIRLVARTLRIKWSDHSGYFDNLPASPAIYCIWHNRLALCMTIYHSYVKKRSKAPGLVALISASKDGGFLAAILENFYVQPVRGSSSRRGAQSLRELTTWARRKFDIAITPDGPRGPRCVVQDGVMALAQLTGLPIVPVSYRLGWKIQLKSWDRFQIPLPFSRCEIIIKKPICVPRETSAEQRELFRRELERQLREISGD